MREIPQGEINFKKKDSVSACANQPPGFSVPGKSTPNGLDS